MTVKELIEILEQFPLTATIYTVHANDDAQSDYTDPYPYFDDISGEVHI